MREKYWTVQINYHKKPRPGQYFEIEYDKKSEALASLSEHRSLGFNCKLVTYTEMPLFFTDPREEVVEKEVIIIPNKRGRKAKYL